MDSLAPYHPLIVHTPIALLIVSLLFEIVGRATDSAWWRNAAFAMLIVGTLGACAAVVSGDPAAHRADELQGVPKDAIESHEDAGKIAMWMGLGAVVTRAIAGGMGAARPFVAGLALLLHVFAASSVGMASYRGGKLVYEHGAGVRVHGELIRSDLPHMQRVDPGRSSPSAPSGAPSSGSATASGN
jgi:uncharacterized membrane protein